MTIVLTIAMMAIIGAIIGGVTNSIAIKMLFRPYRPIYIGKVRLPFTPGLIPKRHKDVAYQLGRMVVNHLLTPEGIAKKLHSDEFKQPIITFFQKQAKEIIHSEQTVRMLSERWMKQDNMEQWVKEKVNTYIEQTYRHKMDEIREKKIQDMMPDKLLVKGERYIETITLHLLKSSSDFFQSEEGKARLTVMVDQFFDSRGGMLGMLGKFMDMDSITDKVQREIVQLLHQEDTKQVIERLLQREYDKLLEKNISVVEDGIGREKIIGFIQNQLVSQLPIQQWLDKTVEELFQPYEHTIIDEYVPNMVEKAIKKMSNRLPELLEHLYLADVVRDEVLSFPLERLEGMILEISRREFKMITYLGALLGGLIGIVQGIIALFL